MLNSDILIGSASLVIAAVIFFATRDLSKLGGIFVNYCLTVFVALAVLELIKGFIKPERVEFFTSVTERNNVVVGLVILIIYLAIMPFLGFLPSSFLFFTVMTLYLGEEGLTTRNILVSAGLAVVVVTMFYFIFKEFLMVPLPSGSFFEAS
ncbi:tripartite tricarboxylate transporter TctB family protein [Oceanidesulfovibrio marinus]|uniref:Tripartite tricarboxylate transporter TctB family protein n=1 Tax=Oceanidesulfovibrio marinus TaxID=370038 RepID=A0A6P1ZQG1_9BACT|nr:tripartite tricarboxylate transporter TctB family protein [Oceanidesulfovibrio marinus]QJT08754.1 tripartite tricarboxylate transporter TctB family protein [Oceanidesulfovibrio marinus]TVM36818.1 hypothetical protein DQK91_02540 [Oceanidesulfovibrio marinus]